MTRSSPDRLVRGLAALATAGFRVLLFSGALVLAGAPAVKLMGTDTPRWVWGAPVRVELQRAGEMVTTRWGTAELAVEAFQGSLRLPLATIPWWLFGVLWLHAAVVLALVLFVLHQLRYVFQRIGAGASFDETNASRVRRLGLGLLALALLHGVGPLIASLAVRGTLGVGELRVVVALPVQPWAVASALVLVALGEVFRRGATLEHEQSLVV